MNKFERIIQRVLENFFLKILNSIYYFKWKGFFYQNTISNISKIKFSIILPTYNSNSNYLTECIKSIINQTYQNWEICISDDASNNKNTLNVLKKYSYNPKIKITLNKKNQHIAINSNKASELATGEYFCFLDHDDILWPNALNEIANVLNKNSKIKFIYTDQDKILNNKHLEPFLKPEFDKNLIKNINYFNHFTIIRKSVFFKLKGFKKGTEGAQDWDLYLRMLKIIKPNEIYHLNKILYSWRISISSTAGNLAKSYAYTNQKKILKNNFPKDIIQKTPYLGIWQINNQKHIKPYQILFNSLIKLIKH